MSHPFSRFGAPHDVTECSYQRVASAVRIQTVTSRLLPAC